MRGDPGLPRADGVSPNNGDPERQHRHVTPAVGHGLRGPARLSALHMLRARGAHNVAGAAGEDPRDNAGYSASSAVTARPETREAPQYRSVTGRCARAVLGRVAKLRAGRVDSTPVALLGCDMVLRHRRHMTRSQVIITTHRDRSCVA